MAIKRAGIGAREAALRLLATEATDETEGERSRLAGTVAAVAGELLVGSETLGLVTATAGLVMALASFVDAPVF